MPLKKGSSRKTVSANIEEMVDEWKKDGAIGTSRPASKRKAVKQATAIALKKAGKSRSQTGAKKAAPAKKAAAKPAARKNKAHVKLVSSRQSGASHSTHRQEKPIVRN